MFVSFSDLVAAYRDLFVSYRVSFINFRDLLVIFDPNNVNINNRLLLHLSRALGLGGEDLYPFSHLLT